MTTRGYQNYRGKKNGKRILLVVVLILVLILCAGYLILQDYIVYDSSGNISLNLPFFSQGEPDTAKTNDSGGERLPIEIVVPEDSGRTEGQAAFSVVEQPLYELWGTRRRGPDPVRRGWLRSSKGRPASFTTSRTGLRRAPRIPGR